MKEIVYLVGQISTNAPRCFEWRTNVCNYFKNRSDFEIINPCEDAFNNTLINSNIKDREKVYQQKGIQLLVPRDRMYVKKSTIGVANLNHYDEEKAIVGSFFELSWYMDCPEKPVIAIFRGNRKKDIVGFHPFIERAVDVWVQDEMEACDLLEYYFKK